MVEADLLMAVSLHYPVTYLDGDMERANDLC